MGELKERNIDEKESEFKPMNQNLMSDSSYSSNPKCILIEYQATTAGTVMALKIMYWIKF